MTSCLELLLQQQLKQLVQMNELLLTERETFATRQSTEIKQINTQKLAALDTLKQTDSQIASQFNEDDFNTPQIQALKNDIDKQIGELKLQNEVNGKIIAHSQVNINMLKDILIGNIGGNIGGKKDRSAMTYDQAGQKSSLIKGRAIKA